MRNKELFDEAVEVIRKEQVASTSMMQRYFRMTFKQACELLDELEKEGIVGPEQGAKPREILLKTPKEVNSQSNNMLNTFETSRKLSEIQNFHYQAMDLAELAFFKKKHKGDEKGVTSLLKQALEFETKAAMLLKDDNDCEPTRSVMFRSASSLAFTAGMKKEQIELATEGLRFCVHDELKAELNDLLS